jgi:hypothetical protein
MDRGTPRLVCAVASVLQCLSDRTAIANVVDNASVLTAAAGGGSVVCFSCLSFSRRVMIKLVLGTV